MTRATHVFSIEQRAPRNATFWDADRRRRFVSERVLLINYLGIRTLQSGAVVYVYAIQGVYARFNSVRFVERLVTADAGRCSLFWQLAALDLINEGLRNGIYSSSKHISVALAKPRRRDQSRF